MKKRKILIYDDDPEAVVRWKQKLDDREQIGRSFETFIIRKNDFQSAVDGLEKRRREARQGSNPEPKWNNRLDQTDIFIIDYDLLDADSPSGEEIAYLVRCYSRCGWIIALNQFDKGYGAFDLTLRGHPESFADLNIGDPLLDNPGLWAEPWEGFRPWAWPLLSLALGKFERRIRKLRGNLTRLILEYLMFPEMISRSLPRTTVEFLTKLDDPMKATFVDFVGKSGNGLRGKDQPFCEESSIRIAAARISHWLESLVLPGQNILVDAPHLVSRYPSLLGERSGDRKAWNATASFKKHNELGLDPVINKYYFKQADWLSKPAWFWPEVSNCQKILEVVNPWAMNRPKFEFCEDVSIFMPKEATRVFVADLPSQFVHRFVVDFHSPQGEIFASDLGDIVYPQVRFLL